MAMLFAIAPRIFNVTARRETIGLAVATVAAAAVIAFSHSYVSRPATPAQQGWTGHLASAASSGATQMEPMSTSSLVVPKSALTLPPTAPKPIVHAKNACDSADRFCVVRPVVSVTAVLPKRQVAAVNPQGALSPALIPPPAKAHVDKPAQEAEGFSLNPLNHVPDMSTIARPFTAVGQTVSGWIKWL